MRWLSYHWLVGVLLELDQPDARYILEVQVAILTLEIVAAVQIGEKRRRRNSGRFFAINFVSRYVMRLQKRLEQKIKRGEIKQQSNTGRHTTERNKTTRPAPHRGRNIACRLNKRLSVNTQTLLFLVFDGISGYCGLASRFFHPLPSSYSKRIRARTFFYRSPVKRETRRDFSKKRPRDAGNFPY